MKKAHFGIIIFLSLKCYFLKSYGRENCYIYAEKEQSYQPAIVLTVFLSALQIEIQHLQSVLHYHVITTNASSGISPFPNPAPPSSVKKLSYWQVLQ